MNGLTLQICFGRYGGFAIFCDTTELGFCLAFVSVRLIFRDMDIFHGQIQDYLERKPQRGGEGE